MEPPGNPARFKELIDLVLPLLRPENTSRTSSKPPATDRKEQREHPKPGHEGHSRALSTDPQPELDPDRLVFLDETAAATNMARRYGWAPRGERCRLAAPFGHYKTTTIPAALRTSWLCATALLGGPTNGRRFRSYVTETLIPVLQPGDIAVMDNLPAHKVAGVRASIEAAGARLLTFHLTAPISTRLNRPSRS
ncbi:DDE superfamily endonuclease [Methylobacterium sp. 190mf]|nr:DDE superfamily endonuclease [Methylobacterium sp. 190mf]